MTSFASQVCYAGIIGSGVGGIINGTIGAISDHIRDCPKHIIIGIIAGAAIAGLGMAIIASNNTGVVLGAIAGSIVSLSIMQDPGKERLTSIVARACLIMGGSAAIGYMTGQIGNYFLK